MRRKLQQHLATPTDRVIACLRFNHTQRYHIYFDHKLGSTPLLNTPS